MVSIRWDALVGVSVAALLGAVALPAAAQQSTTQETRQDAREAGQKAEQPAERTERRQDGGTLSDAWLTAKTKLSLLADEDVSGMSINVDTRDGVVTLKGDVESETEKAKAVQLARKVEGVKDVQDQLVVKPESETRAARTDQPAGQSGAAPGTSGASDQARRDDDQIAKDVRQAIQSQWRGGQLRLDGETLKGAQDTQIEVKVDDGIVTLEGKVPDVRDIVQAAQAARKVQGVRAVKTNVESGRPS